MKKIVFFLISALFPTLSFSQNVDGGATEIVSKIAEKYQGFSTIIVSYSYKAEKNNDIFDTKKGKATFKGSRYAVNFGNNSFYCDGSSVWNYEKEINEVSIFSYDKDDENSSFLNPFAVLSNWNKNFKAKLIRNEFKNGRQVAVIDLTPLKDFPFYRVRLSINNDKHEILSIAMYEKDNTVYSYTIEQALFNQTVNDKIFVFDKTAFPGVEINDMR